MGHNDIVGLSPTHPNSSHHNQSTCVTSYRNLCKGHKTKGFWSGLHFHTARLRSELSVI